MRTIKDLIEEINALAEDEFVDEFESDLDLTPTEEPVAIPEAPTPEANVTEKLEARTNISRALDILKKAIEEFKDNTIEDIEFIGDSMLLQSIESLDSEIQTIASSLEIGNPEKAESPVADIESEPIEDEELGLDLSELENESEDEEFEDNEDDEFEPDFEAEAGLDLFGSAE